MGFFVDPSRIHHPIGEPTSFPTVVPDPAIFQEIGKGGMQTLWVVFTLMTIAFFLFSALSWRVSPQHRLIPSLTTTIVLVNGLTYLAMATGSGWYWQHYRIREKHDHGVPDTFQHVHRQVFWVRSIDWLITTPLIVVDLALLAGLPGSNIYSVVVANLVMVISGILASMAHSSGGKWGWFIVAVAGYVWILYTLGSGIKTARTSRTSSTALQKLYTSIMSYSVVVWFAYLVISAVASNTHRLSVDSEILAFAILDVLTKGVFGLWLLSQHSVYSEHTAVEGFWANGFEGAIRIADEEN